MSQFHDGIDPDVVFDKATQEFEKQCSKISHSTCFICKSVSLSISLIIKKDSFICKLCNTKHSYDKKDPYLLPAWIDKNNDKVHFELPNELLKLTEAEKLLIQRSSTYIPLVHMSKGQLGLHGHVCSFPQNVQDIVDVLPRLPEDITIVKVIRKTNDTEGNINIRSFRVRRKKVLDALFWLQKHNTEYNDIVIKPDRLDWIPNDLNEADLPVANTNSADVIEISNDKMESELDMGPSFEPNQINTEGTYGTVTNSFPNVIKKKDKELSDEIIHCINVSIDAPLYKKKHSISFVKI